MDNNNQQQVSYSQINPAGVRPAGTWARYWASVIDSLIISIPILLIVFVFFFDPKALLMLTNGDHEGDGLSTIIIGLLVIVINFSYSVYLTVNKGATWGKDAYGLRVVIYGSTNYISYGKATLRELVKTGVSFVPIIGGLIYLINGIMIIFSHNKRGIHDRIAGTQVIKATNPWSMRKQLAIIPLLILLPIFIVAIGMLLRWK